MIILRLLLLLTNLHLKLLSTQGTGGDKLLSTQRVKMTFMKQKRHKIGKHLSIEDLDSKSDLAYLQNKLASPSDEEPVQSTPEQDNHFLADHADRADACLTSLLSLNKNTHLKQFLSIDNRHLCFNFVHKIIPL